MTETRPFMLLRLAEYEARKAELVAMRLPAGCWNALQFTNGRIVAPGHPVQTRKALLARDLIEKMTRPNANMKLTALGREVAAWIQGRSK